jgi:hypothetical protein
MLSDLGKWGDITARMRSSQAHALSGRFFPSLLFCFFLVSPVLLFPGVPPAPLDGWPIHPNKTSQFNPKK